MTKTQQTLSFLSVLATGVLPAPIRRRTVMTMGQTQKLFEVKPAPGEHNALVEVTFGRQILSCPCLLLALEELRIAVEAVLFETTTASVIRLDDNEWQWAVWMMEQREQGSD